MRQDAIAGPSQPEIFALMPQLSPAALRNSDAVLVVRTATDPTAYVATLRGVVHEQAPTAALDSVMTMEDRVMTGLAWPRLYALVVGWFGLFAVLVTGVGLFGVLSFSVAQRRREIAVRSALGAQRDAILLLVLRQAFWIVAIGVATGMASAFAGATLLARFLHGVAPHDATTFVLVGLAIVVLEAIACVVPARRAARIDPITALRSN